MKTVYYSPQLLIRKFNESKSLEKVPNWLLYLFVFTIFSKEVGTVFLAGIEYDFIGYTFCIVYFIFRINRLFLNTYLSVFLLGLLICSIISKVYFSIPFSGMFKQWIPITLTLVVCYDFITRVNNTKRIFKAYITVAYYTAVIGILQLTLKVFFGIKIFTGYSAYFIDSIAREPSHYAALITPACVYSIICFRSDKLRGVVILLAAVGTFSTTTFVVLMISLVLIYLNPIYLLLLLPLLYLLYNNVLMNYEKFNERIVSMSLYFEGTSMSKITNATSLSFISNFEVAKYSIKQNPLIGAGLGGHEEMYHRYFANSSFKYYYLYGLNALSAHSLIIRIASEWGLFGLFFYLFFLIKTLVINPNTYHRIISIACLSHFLCKSLKLGSYFDYGTPFFAVLMWINFLDYKKYIRSQNSQKNL